jgi:hypothetical protein
VKVREEDPPQVVKVIRRSRFSEQPGLLVAPADAVSAVDEIDRISDDDR